MLWSTLLRRSPYSHPTIGWEKDIRGYTLDDCFPPDHIEDDAQLETLQAPAAPPPAPLPVD